VAHVRTRLSLVEYGSPIDLSRAIAAAIGVDRARANKLLIDAGNRAASSLGLNYNPISIDAKGARAIDFAGLIRLAPSVELEVAPKCLGLDDADARRLLFSVHAFKAWKDSGVRTSELVWRGSEGFIDLGRPLHNNHV
jgi:hypothetical protein